MKTVPFALFVALLAVACGEDSPVGPSPIDKVDKTGTPPPIILEPSPPLLPDDPDDPGPADPPLYVIDGPGGGCLEGLSHSWTIAVSDPDYRLRTASFHSPEAGCTATTHGAGGSFDRVELGPGVSRFDWAGGRSCGRYQADIAIGTEDFVTIVGAVINTGVDCEPPPPPPPGCQVDCEPPPPPPTCEELGTCPPPPCQVDCEPPPPPLCEAVSYDGPAWVELANSGAATELAFAQSISPTLVAAGKIEPGGLTWVADGTYAVVLVKAGTRHYVYVNVSPGDVLGTDGEHGISHVSRFVCGSLQ